MSTLSLGEGWGEGLPFGFWAPHRDFCCFCRGLGFNDRFLSW